MPSRSPSEPGPSLPGGWRRWTRIWRPDASADLDDELGFHVDMRTEEYVAAGMTPQDARAEALRRLGDLDAARRDCGRLAAGALTRTRHREWRAALQQDLRYAVRTLARAPALTVAVLLTLTLGIGANSAIFSVVNGVLLRPLPFGHPDQLVSVYDIFPNLDLPHSSLSEPEVLDVAGIPAFESVTAYRANRRTITGAGEPERVPVLLTTAEFSRTLEVPPMLGRFFGPAEDQPGAPQRSRWMGSRRRW